jgi:uncharacterized integral membrane protein
MPWRMIFFLFIMLLVVLFIAMNVNHTSDISFGIVSWQDVPVYLSLFIAFSAGVLLTIPMVLLKRGRKKDNGFRSKKAKGGKKEKPADLAVFDDPGEDQEPQL